MFPTWTPTVFWLMNRRSPISRLVRPWATSAEHLALAPAQPERVGPLGRARRIAGDRADEVRPTVRADRPTRRPPRVGLGRGPHGPRRRPRHRARRRPRAAARSGPGRPARAARAGAAWRRAAGRARRPRAAAPAHGPGPTARSPRPASPRPGASARARRRTGRRAPPSLGATRRQTAPRRPRPRAVAGRPARWPATPRRPGANRPSPGRRAARTSPLAASTTWAVRWRAAASGASWRLLARLDARSPHRPGRPSRPSARRAATPRSRGPPPSPGRPTGWHRRCRRATARTRRRPGSTGRPAAARARRRTRGSSGRAAATRSRRRPSRSRRSRAGGREAR